MVNKTVIINAPDKYNIEGENGCSPPLGSLRIALSAKEAGADVRFIDGQHYTSLDSVLEKVPYETELAGISFNRVNIPIVRPLINGLFKKGVKQIVAGNQAIIPIGEMFVQDFADPRIMACSGDGEPTINGLVAGKCLQDIPNLDYFEDGKVKKTEQVFIDYQEIGMLEYSLIDGFDWKNYYEFTHNVFGEGVNQASAYFNDGCPRRIKEGCSFCARRKTGKVRSMTPEIAYEQLSYLKKQGANEVNLNDDTFFTNLHLLEGLVGRMEKKPLGLKLNAYACVSDLTPKNLDLAYRLGIKSVLVGVESGNSYIRKLNGKPISDKQIWTTAKNCKERGIGYDAAFVLGMIGETEKTARETVDLAKKLIDLDCSSNIYASLFMPFPGSPSYKKIKRKLENDPILFLKYGNQFNRWDYDWSKLIDAQVEVMTTTSRNYLCDCLSEIDNYNKSARSVIADYSGK